MPPEFQTKQIKRPGIADTVIQELGHNAGEIGCVIDTIVGTASQTNLLARNALSCKLAESLSDPVTALRNMVNRFKI